MSPREPKKLARRVGPGRVQEDACATQTVETVTGVRVVVREQAPAPPAPPEPPEPPAPQRLARRAIIAPDGQALAAFMESAYDEHGAFILRTLQQRWKLQPASADDLRQNVMVILFEQAGTKEPPENVRGFLQGVMWNQVLHRGRKRKHHLFLLDGDADAALSPGIDPERAVAFAEHRAKARQYIKCLPEVEAEVVQLIDLMGLTLDEAAAALDRPRGTVSTQHIRARKALRDRAQASARGTKLGHYQAAR
jgi:RNA polymerase sigma-70 factor (ECF subfamily)